MNRLSSCLGQQFLLVGCERRTKTVNDKRAAADLPWVLLHGIAFEPQVCQADKEPQTPQHGYMLQLVGGHVQAFQGRQAPLLCNRSYEVVFETQLLQLRIAEQLRQAGDPEHVPADHSLQAHNCLIKLS